jgi:hypothetical protein
VAMTIQFPLVVNSDDAGRFQYGGETFETACDFAGVMQGRRPPKRSHVAERRLPGPVALTLTVASLPRLSIGLSDSPSGKVIRDHLRARRFGVPKNRWAQGVLALPASEEEYLRRGSRIVGRQVRRARAAQVTCRELTSSWQRELLLRAITERVYGMDTWVDTLPDRPDDHWWAAHDQAGDPAGFAIVVVDADWAMLELLKTTDHPTRYLLHTEIVTALARSGVRYLLTDSPMVFRMNPHLRSFQRLLGYQVAHLGLE